MAEEEKKEDTNDYYEEEEIDEEEINNLYPLKPSTPPLLKSPIEDKFLQIYQIEADEEIARQVVQIESDERLAINLMKREEEEELKKEKERKEKELIRFPLRRISENEINEKIVEMKNAAFDKYLSNFAEWQKQQKELVEIADKPLDPKTEYDGVDKLYLTL